MIGRAFTALAAAVLWAAVFASGPHGARAETAVTVFAAASLHGPLQDALEGFDAPVRISTAGSSALARQILAGAPADIFISANEAWMDALEREGLLRPGSRTAFLRNRLVLVGPAAADAPREATADTIRTALGDGRLAMALVDAVPAGIYGKAALEALGLWDEVAPNVVQSDNVRSALALVSRGEASAGIVYATDAALAPDLAVLATFDEAHHGPIVYPLAQLTMGLAPPQSAEALAQHLTSPAAAAIFTRAGFLAP